MKNHYFKSKVIKMGIWSLAPNDCETWHGENTSRYFKKVFGIPKGILILYEVKKNFQHAYVPINWVKLLHSRIDAINKKDFRGLEKKLKTFYPLRAKAKHDVASKQKNPKKLSNAQLANEFLRIRDWIQHLAIYDQFAWLAEEYWTPKIENILVKKLKLEKGSVEYNRVLFTLSKPQEISTTLLEKKAVFEQAIKLKQKKTTLQKGAAHLAKAFGWLPVFCYGTPWEAQHYLEDLKNTAKLPLKKLENDYQNLKDYTKLRNAEFEQIVKQYSIEPKDAQTFIDFGLAIDTRNEAEYFVSFGGFYLLPLYAEIAKRLYLSVFQTRLLFEKEMIDALKGKANAHKILQERGAWGGSWGFDQNINVRLNFETKEAEKLFKHIENYVKPVQGGDENKGFCASPGIAKGKIRIIPSPDQNNRVKDGDILVTYSTTTDYLPAMKRAAAIITEVGGLTCHAAVVSREFGIPCIVALTNAMSNLKDGQLVEVNANEGTVKKL